MSYKIPISPLHPIRPFCMETRCSSFQPVNKIVPLLFPPLVNKQKANRPHTYIYVDARTYENFQGGRIFFFLSLSQNASVVSVKVTSHGYYARFTHESVAQVDRSFPIYHKDRLFRIEIARRSVNVSLRSCNGHFQCLFRVSLSLSVVS